MKPRSAGVADAAVLSRAHGFGFDPAWPPGEIAALVSSPGVFALLVDDGPRPIAMILCRVVADEAEILTVAVDPDARGQGVGAALLRAALQRAQAAGAGVVFLEVAADNAPAAALYARAGFLPTGVRKGYYDRGAAGQVDGLAMRLDFPHRSV